MSVSLFMHQYGKMPTVLALNDYINIHGNEFDEKVSHISTGDVNT